MPPFQEVEKECIGLRIRILKRRLILTTFHLVGFWGFFDTESHKKRVVNASEPCFKLCAVKSKPTSTNNAHNFKSRDFQIENHLLKELLRLISAEKIKNHVTLS